MNKSDQTPTEHKGGSESRYHLASDISAGSGSPKAANHSRKVRLANDQ